jgi:D-3-phosphoglycerate dehydrogenase
MSEQELVVHTDKDQPVDAADAEAFAGLGMRLAYISTEAEFLAVASQALAVLNSNFRLTATLIDALTRCRVISRYGSGVDNIDVAAATRKGIPVAYVPVFCVEEVANRAFTLLLACSCDLPRLDRLSRNGVWGVQNLQFGAQLEERILGLVGYGKIGRAVARRAKAFGLKVIAYDPYVSPELAAGEGVSSCSLEELLAAADYVSVHTPLNAQTRRLLNADRLRMMKPTAFLINTSRGGVIDESALVEALVQRRIAGAGLDVLEQEPPPKDHPLFALNNVILTPHCAAHTELATRKVRRGAIDAVMRVLRGQWPENLVNPEVLKTRPATVNR